MFFVRNEMCNDLRHISHARRSCGAYAEDVEEQARQIRDDLEPLEAGKMTVGEREGNGAWRAMSPKT